MSAPGKAGEIQPVEVRPKLRSSVRLVASVAWPLATVVRSVHGEAVLSDIPQATRCGVVTFLFGVCIIFQ